MGSTWIEISPDLTRGVPKEMQKLMGQSWSIDQLARKGSMAQIVTIAESPIDENILFVGSGDGLIYYTTDGGTNWSRGSTTGLPEYARIHHLIASNFNKLVAYAACDNFVGGDYRPYLYKTTEGGKNGFQSTAIYPKKEAHIQFRKITLIKICFLSERNSEYTLRKMEVMNGFL
jgi:hypothetical protein